jgi:hypothetical protein
MTLSITKIKYNTQYKSTPYKCCADFHFMLSFMNKPFILSVIMLSGIMLSVVVIKVISAKKLMGHLMVREEIKIFTSSGVPKVEILKTS